MTRLSDSLRGLADRAPIDHATVSVAGAARRVQRGRRLRAAANATAGVGVAAVVALAAIHPGASGAISGADAADAAMDTGGGDAPAIATMEDNAYLWEWGACGSLPLHDGDPTVGDSATLQLGLAADAFEPGELVSAELTLLPNDGVGDLATPGIATVIVMWDGFAVARSDVAAVYTDGVAAIETPLVNCWDGAMLPAGDYQMIVVHGVYPTSPDAAGEDGVEVVEGVDEVSEPAPTPSTSVDPNPDGSVSITVEPQSEAQRVVSNLVDLEITGERMDDPFGVYLWGTLPTSYPEDYLTPDVARAEYAAHVSLEPWNMAAGTQRVVMIHDGLSGDPVDYPNSRYFGCAGEQATMQGFPRESATWDLLGVTATLPKKISVSYGWVVDDNPEVGLSVANLSEYSLPGFWIEPNGTLMLVKDGMVKAESYLTSLDRSAAMNAPVNDGMLAPGGELASRYLWREVSGCWVGNNPQPVEPGTYTVLNVHSLYLDNGSQGVYTEPYLGEGIGGEADDARTAIASFPSVDYVEMQVWTSLGTVTVG